MNKLGSRVCALHNSLVVLLQCFSACRGGQEGRGPSLYFIK